MSFRFPVRVYYEDTDAGGIVYDANYLKFIERARSEALLALGISQTGLRARRGVVFAVRSVTVDYRAPARLEDDLVVATSVTAVGGARIEMIQDVMRDDATLVACRVTLACLGTEGRPARIPAEVRSALAGVMAAP
jgi:acyl-CoA thioester hydrolase